MGRPLTAPGPDQGLVTFATLARFWQSPSGRRAHLEDTPYCFAASHYCSITPMLAKARSPLPLPSWMS
ncbi:hypothetical protein EON65_33215 [archaeon]|nr:MAG: hypothetical protein EON65_33215 [archaeon]